MPSHFKKLKVEVEKGILGRNHGIPFSLNKAGKYLSIRKGLYTLIGAGGGCLALDTPVIMYNGRIKKVQDIVEGDLLMGPDSKPRTVQQLKKGTHKCIG